MLTPSGQSHSLSWALGPTRGAAFGQPGQCVTTDLAPPQPEALQTEEGWIPSLPLPFFKMLLDSMVDSLESVSLYKI